VHAAKLRTELQHVTLLINKSYKKGALCCNLLPNIISCSRK